MTDITTRKHAETKARLTQSRDVLEALPAAVYTTDAEGRITFYNAAAVKLWGCEPELGRSEWCGSWRLYFPDGKPMRHDECPMAVALKTGRQIFGEDAVAERPDGTLVPFMPYPTPLRDADGRIIGAINMLVDLTLTKEAEERRRQLVNELNHRVKNTLSAVQSIAMQSFRGESRAAEQFEGRLLALAKAHDVLTRETWQGAGLQQLIDEICGNSCRSRLGARGPIVRLPPRTALALAMSLHELCANAASHGALSVPSGSITIEWSLSRTERGGVLHLRWMEHGGPAVLPPEQSGFGLRLIERALPRELSGEVRLDFPPTGVVCDIHATLA